MSELWQPTPYIREQPVSVYDVAVLYQEQLDAAETLRDKHLFAHFARKALSRMVGKMSSDEKNIIVSTDIALVEDYDENHSALLTDVGLRGELTCLDFTLSPEFSGDPFSLVLEIDAEAAFAPSEPDRSALLMNAVKTPIKHVRYIETLSA